jgi:hypothetical protein
MPIMFASQNLATQGIVSIAVRWKENESVCPHSGHCVRNARSRSVSAPHILIVTKREEKKKKKCSQPGLLASSQHCQRCTAMPLRNSGAAVPQGLERNEPSPDTVGKYKV